MREVPRISLGTGRQFRLDLPLSVETHHPLHECKPNNDLQRQTVRLQFAKEVLLVLVLAFLVLSLTFTAFRVASGMDSYYVLLQPYIGEMSNHSLQIMRHADVSAQHLELLMQQTAATAAASLPEIESSVNRSAAMVSRLESFAAHPTVQLSMGA